MADFWLINGKTNLVRGAKRRSRNNRRKGGLMARRKKSHRRKHHRNPARKSRRSRRYHRNPSMNMGGVGTALLWGGLGYLGSKLAGSFIGKYLPSAIPARDLVGAAASGALVSFAGGYVAKSSEAKAALRVGALIPAVETAVNMTSLGSMLGTQKVILLPAPGSGGAPSGVAAALHAALSADLNDGESLYSGY